MSNYFCEENDNNNYMSDYILEGGFPKDKQYMTTDLVNSTNDFSENNRMPVIPPNHYSEDNEYENLLIINDENKNILFLEENKYNNMDIDEKNSLDPFAMILKNCAAGMFSRV